MATKADLAHNGEAGLAMTAFVEDWCDRAEAALDFAPENDPIDPVAALRASLEAAEQHHGSPLSFSMLTQAIIIVMGIWGVEAGYEFTVFEERAVMEMIAIKQQELQQAARAPIPG